MASEKTHIAAANRTQKTISHLLSDKDRHSPWIATTAFYKALHVVEAVFANDHSVEHTSNHDERAQKLKTIRKYENIAKHYLPLFRASMVARYLVSHDTFDAFMTPDKVESRLLRHYLLQVEKSSRKFLTSPDDLQDVAQALAGRDNGS
jgi:hypothetical protein